MPTKPPMPKIRQLVLPLRRRLLRSRSLSHRSTPFVLPPLLGWGELSLAQKSLRCHDVRHAVAGATRNGGWNRRNRKAFETTLTLESPIAPAAKMGLSSPNAATGINTVL